MKHTLRIAVLGFLLTACLPVAPASVPPTDPGLVTANPYSTFTPTPFQPLPATSPAPPTATLTPLPPPTATLTLLPALPSPTAPPLPVSPPGSGTRPHYIIYALLDYKNHQVAVQQTIEYTNQTDTALDTLILAVEPNLWVDCFLLTSLTQDNTAVNVALGGQRMTVTLLQPLQPGETTVISLGYQLNLPLKKFEGTFGYLDYQLNLTNWYPFVVPYIPGQGWLLHEPWTFGEHLVYDSADYDVYLQLAPGGESVIVAASAQPVVEGYWQHYHLEGARTFVLSASEYFNMAESAVGSVVIRSYYFGKQGAGERIASAATQAVAIFQSRFGPYPYESLSIVAADLPDGQEFDGLVFVADEFYSQYQGGVKNNLVSIGVHEIAHQWWFGLVGNDQAMEPWLDEALAAYSERIFYEHYNLTTWWWSFRVNYFSPTGWVDTTIYEGESFRSYTNAAYLRGAHFMEKLRLRMGDDDFFAFLQDYAALHGRGRATTGDFFSLVYQHTDADLSDLVSAYFQQVH